MEASLSHLGRSLPSRSAAPLRLADAERLERGELLPLPAIPFSAPRFAQFDRVLHESRVTARDGDLHFYPATATIDADGLRGAKVAEPLAGLLADFSQHVVAWLAQALPHAAGHFRPERVSFRPTEEATRRHRLRARNDLLHIDTFAGRPSWGQRILRVGVNLDPVDPRVWTTSDSLRGLLARYGASASASAGRWWDRFRSGLQNAFRSHLKPRSADAFLVRFNDFLAHHEGFQERGPRRLWRFPPVSAWIAFTDACSHAELRGQNLLEHTFLIAPGGLLLPNESPVNLVDEFFQSIAANRAA